MLIKPERRSPQELVCVGLCVCVRERVRSTGVRESDGTGLKGGEILVVVKKKN